jgi:hypothetical protein
MTSSRLKHTYSASASTWQASTTPSSARWASGSWKIDTVLRGWSSDGQIFAALAAITDPSLDMAWSARDIRRRAHRVMLGKLEDTLQQWPTSAQQWAEHLPITTISERTITPTIAGRVNWAETVRRFGWPPAHFVTRSRSRTADEVALTTLA